MDMSETSLSSFSLLPLFLFSLLPLSCTDSTYAGGDSETQMTLFLRG